MKWDKKGVKYLNSLHELKLIGPYSERWFNLYLVFKIVFILIINYFETLHVEQELFE